MMKHVFFFYLSLFSFYQYFHQKSNNFEHFYKPKGVPIIHNLVLKKTINLLTKFT